MRGDGSLDSRVALVKLKETARRAMLMLASLLRRDRSNVAPQVVETGAVEESTVVSSSESESATNAAPVTDPEHAEEVNTPVSAEASNVQSRKSATKTDRKQSDSADNVLQSNLFCEGIEMETEQSEFKVPSKRKKSDDFQAVKAKRAGVEDVL